MRKINELIWHCSATPEGKNFTVEQIRSWHMARGWSDIGYHMVVYLDGSVHPGRPVHRVGAHTLKHNRGTLGYCYIGGVEKDGKTAKDTRTPAQRKAMIALTRAAIADYGVTKVTGHNEYAAKACPSFNVQTDPDMDAALNRPAAPEIYRSEPDIKPDTKEKVMTKQSILNFVDWFLDKFGEEK